MTDSFKPLECPDSKAYKEAARAQSEAANPAQSVWVVANAGSGKTKVLIDRVARLLLRRVDGRPGAAPDSILCITYTKAAANEMLSRLFSTLGNWSVMEDDLLSRRLADLEQREAGDYSQDDLKAARALFARALETPGGLRIETIHAFCARILRRFPLEAGVFPGFSEIDDNDASELWAHARRETILEAAENNPDDLDMLARASGHDGALKALDNVRANAQTLRNFAAAHKGDVSSMEAALRDALKAPQDTPQDLIESAMGAELPVDKLREAAGLLQAGGAPKEIKSAKIINDTLNAGTASERLDTYKALFLKAEGQPRRQNPYNKPTGKTSPELAELLQLADGLGAEPARMFELFEKLKAAESLQKTLALLRVGLPALELYGQMKRQRAVLDFDDLIDRTRALLSTREASEWVLYKLDGGLNHVLIDEAQDTSPAQWELINALVAELFAGQGRERQQEPRTQFVVGDEKQSIFSFQGADPDMFHSERQTFQQRDKSNALPEMKMSFRSSPEVLEFVDKVWNRGAAHVQPAESNVPVSADETVHTARRANQPGRVELWPVTAHAEEEDDPDAWARPLNARLETSPKARLAKEIAETITKMIKARETVWEEIPGDAKRRWQRRACKPEDILILVRERTGGLFDMLIAALKREGLPVAGADRLVLSNHIGVQDCLNLMRFALLPSDDLTLAEILRGPFCGLVNDDNHLFPLAYGRKAGESLWDRLRASKKACFQPAKEFLSNVLARAGWPPFEFLTGVLEAEQAGGKTGWQMINARLGPPSRDPIEALLSRALSHDAAAPTSLQRFLSDMESDDSDIKRDLAAPDGEIRVMTVHGAKGLQAPIVILPDTTSGPRKRAGPILQMDEAAVWSPRKATDTPRLEEVRLMAESKALREHRRLLYVALSRAQDRLIICGAWFGKKPKEGKSPQRGFHAESWYAQCAEAMREFDSPAEDEAPRICVHGEPVPCAKPADAGREPGASDLPDWALRPPPDFADEAPRQIAPSMLMRFGVPVHAPFGEGRKAGMRRGRIIHELLQYLPELAPESRRTKGEEWLSSSKDLGDAARAEMLEAAMRVLEDTELSTLFAPGGIAEAPVIGSAPELPEGALINGRIDRLVVTDDEVLIVDFKTDQPAPKQVSDVGEAYLAQMGAYYCVLRQAYPGRKITAALLWTDGPKLMHLPEESLFAALKKARGGLT